MHEAEWALKKFGHQINEQIGHIVSLFKSHEWSYEGECGPQTWSALYPGARGHHQSPINIETQLTKFEPRLLERPLDIHFDLNCCTQIKNTGYTFQVDAHTKNNAFVKGGPTNHTYHFLQFHMHWGDSLEKGSEHLIDSKPYSAELHFVYWNNDLYPDPKQASESNKNDGLLVLAVFVKVGKHCPEFEKLSNSIHDIHLKDHHVPIRAFDIRKLLPADISAYWTYPGSLTTPPCSECVQWVVFRDNIEVSEDQLEKCHHLYSVSKEKLCSEKTSIKYNDRPVCSMDDRVVLRSFQ